jgi:catechol 2,3-dioxygenase-like lactoylglutathione lyase family enzyme
MNIILSHTVIQVHDQDEALDFYHGVLGLEVRTDVRMDDFRWLTVGPAEQPELEIILELAGMGRPAEAEALRALVAKGAFTGAIFQTDDLDGTFEKVRATGAEVLQEPIDQPYGVRDCAFRDPSGNMIRFSQPHKG